MKTRFPILIPSALFLSIGAIAAMTTPQDGGDIQRPAELQDYEHIVPGTTPDNAWVCEPLLIFDSSGQTDQGLVHFNLSIYNNGMISLAQFNGSGSSRNMSKLVKPAEVRRFYRGVMGTGAWTMKDQKEVATGVPMRSVTLFKGATDAEAHSFNYFSADGDYKSVESMVNNFVRSHFSAQ
ncbi:MAG: hypothetical protein GY711_03955 [bacterium]|nr:hypothetical protein [bacterium]